jgi:hypothetical protein
LNDRRNAADAVSSLTRGGLVHRLDDFVFPKRAAGARTSYTTERCSDTEYPSRIVAVQPHEDFMQYFQAASRCRAGRGNGRGAKSGSDGTRTRDLCRDRAAL